MALRVYSPEAKCKLSGEKLNLNEIYQHQLNSCWENRLSNGKKYEMFILDPNDVNSPEDGFYDCDSIPYKNTILEHYILTLDELRANNFTITYP